MIVGLVSITPLSYKFDNFFNTGMRVCNGGFLTGFRGKVLDYQGIFTDDVALQDFEAECDFGSEIIGGIDVETKVC